MTSQRLLSIANGWVARATDAVRRGNQTDLTIACLAHSMCFAAYKVLSEACGDDPVLPAPKSRVRR